MTEPKTWMGVDFGAKFAGTTAVCFPDNKGLMMAHSTKKQDADQYLHMLIGKLQPTRVFIDAPLSLPGVYTSAGNDYFYREADKMVGAMSPMFLGGLTARAIKLKNAFPDIRFIESYPSYLAKKHLTNVLPSYRVKRKTQQLTKSVLEAIAESPVKNVPANIHQLDAFLCWVIGKRYGEGKAQYFGNEQEGLIWV